MNKEKQDRKLMRGGGSIVVAIPKKVRRDLNIGLGDRLKIWAVEGRYIVMEKGKQVRGENTYLTD
jgi:AbrB family looped-hinge helix DNA binding protein